LFMARVMGSGVIIALWVARWRHVVVFFALVVHPLFHPLPGHETGDGPPR